MSFALFTESNHMISLRNPHPGRYLSSLSRFKIIIKLLIDTLMINKPYHMIKFTFADLLTACPTKIATKKEIKTMSMYTRYNQCPPRPTEALEITKHKQDKQDLTKCQIISIMSIIFSMYRLQCDICWLSKAQKSNSHSCTH